MTQDDVRRGQCLLDLPNRGPFLGGRDHSTVMHGIGKIEREIETNTALRQQVSTIREALYG